MANELVISLNCDISIVEFETKRLLARRIQQDDLAELCRMHHDSQVMATLGGARDDEQSRQMLDAYLEHWNRLGFGIWMWFSKADGRFVGRGGVRPIFVDGADQIEISYALMPEFWGQGFATEMAAASVNVAFRQLGLSELISFTLPTNAASRRVMEKCGFALARNIVWRDLPHVLYKLKREDYGHHVRQQ